VQTGNLTETVSLSFNHDLVTFYRTRIQKERDFTSPTLARGATTVHHSDGRERLLSVFPLLAIQYQLKYFKEESIKTYFYIKTHPDGTQPQQWIKAAMFPSLWCSWKRSGINIWVSVCVINWLQISVLCGKCISPEAWCNV